ncbi:MAG: hypothetical protein JJU05_01955 [Verrucomicrobia bacterium]|nr:hypothetical protein [Verrucomicrobiota bacterium]MCH8526173.1 hypothetical protein [Kiritimatiellia bacterium]
MNSLSESASPAAKPYHWDAEGNLVITDPSLGKDWWNRLKLAPLRPHQRHPRHRHRPLGLPHPAR